jgi:hypothetical protein
LNDCPGGGEPPVGNPPPPQITCPNPTPLSTPRKPSFSPLPTTIRRYVTCRLPPPDRTIHLFRTTPFLLSTAPSTPTRRISRTIHIIIHNVLHNSATLQRSVPVLSCAPPLLLPLLVMRPRPPQTVYAARRLRPETGPRPSPYLCGSHP